MVQFTIHQALQHPPTASGTSASLEPGSWRGRRRKGRCEGGEAVSEPHARLCDMDAWHRCSPPVALWSAQLAQVAPMIALSARLSLHAPRAPVVRLYTSSSHPRGRGARGGELVVGRCGGREWCAGRCCHCHPRSSWACGATLLPTPLRLQEGLRVEILSERSSRIRHFLTGGVLHRL
jgi:hypothetical protein